MADVQIKNIQLSKLKPNTGQIEGLPANPRLIKDGRYKKLVQSIKDDPEMLSLRELIVYPQNGHFITIAGNMRLRAMGELKYKNAPCKILPKDTPVQKLKAYTIKDNIPFGEHDWDMIANEWDAEQLTEWGLDIPDFALNKDAVEDDYEIPDEIETDIVLGDLFEIGRHRLLCGDSTKADDVARLINGQIAPLLATDPPYNVGKEYGDNVDDSKVEKEYEEFTRRWFAAWLVISKAQIVTPGCNNISRWCRYFDSYHIAPWTKTNSMTNGKVARWWCWEPIFFIGDKWKRKRPNDVFDFPISNQKEIGNHPCPKPIKLWGELISFYTDENDVVADAFMGSGTTMVVAHQLNRKCYGMEIEPKYVQVTIDRMLKLDNTLEIKKNGQPYFTDKKQTSYGIPA